jgi:hypothetical protein
MVALCPVFIPQELVPRGGYAAFGEDASATYALTRIQETELSRPFSLRLSSETQRKRVHPLGSSGSRDVVCQLIYDKLPIFNNALDQISN